MWDQVGSAWADRGPGSERWSSRRIAGSCRAAACGRGGPPDRQRWAALGGQGGLQYGSHNQRVERIEFMPRGLFSARAPRARCWKAPQGNTRKWPKPRMRDVEAMSAPLIDTSQGSLMRSAASLPTARLHVVLDDVQRTGLSSTTTDAALGRISQSTVPNGNSPAPAGRCRKISEISAPQ